MPADVAIGCTCGAIEGVIRGVTPSNARRLVCMCDDCQIYAHYLNRAREILDAHGGTELIYATQSRVSISSGRERLRAVKLYDGGMLRVYAGCCSTPVAHVPSPKIAFVGIPHSFLRCESEPAARDALLGPLLHRLQGRYCRGDLPAGAHRGTPRGLWAKAMLSVAWDTARHRQQPSPFHASGSLAPLVVPALLSSHELDELRAQLGHLRAPAASRVPLGCS